MQKEKLLFSNFQIKNKNKINKIKIKELFIQKKDIYLLKLLKKKQEKLEFSIKKSKKDSLYIENVLYSPSKFHFINAELPEIEKKFLDFKNKLNTYLLTTKENENNKNNKDNNIDKNFESIINKTSHRKILKDENTSTTSINDNIYDNLKLSKDRILTRKKIKYDYERIPLKKYMQKIKKNFNYDKYFVENIDDKNKFYNSDKTTKRIKYTNLKLCSFNNIKNNTNFSFSKNKMNLEDNNSLVVIPCKKLEHISIFNDIIFNEFESKKQNSNNEHCYKMNIFDGNLYDSNYLNMYRKKFNKKKNEKMNSYINTLNYELAFSPFYKTSSRKEKKIKLEKKNKINISLQGIPNIVKRFYGFDT